MGGGPDGTMTYLASSFHTDSSPGSAPANNHASLAPSFFCQQLTHRPPNTHKQSCTCANVTHPQHALGVTTRSVHTHTDTVLVGHSARRPVEKRGTRGIS